ncbi:MAG: pectate lyase [Saprospiraceae bacterium]|nr:pectate lyase [Saprospiraceae bacterium]
MKTASCALLLLITALTFINAQLEPSLSEIKGSMKTATNFMMRSVSNQGGFLWKYSADLSEQWGEVPARKSQIWVQPPGTTSVGMMLLKAHGTTGDDQYLRYAEQVADALIWGQLPSGGWHYLIDFDSSGLRPWYDDVAAKCWGWEEYYHYYGNGTFDDGVTASASRFLLYIYLATHSEKYEAALLKALDFILEAQYPNGAWPQRYPIMNDYGHDGHEDYTPYYTYNDDVIHGNIMFLLEAHQKLGDNKFREAAQRGMDFYLISQVAAPQAGWALQYDLALQPAWARSYEPAAISSGQTVRNIKDLMTFYKITGNSKYLSPIPAAIQWLESAVINTDPQKNFSHATFYQPKTNKPLYAHREGTSIDNGRYWVDHLQANFPGHYGMLRSVNVASLKVAFERVRSLTPTEAQVNYEGALKNESKAKAVDSQEIQEIIDAQDNRGAWLEDLQIPHYPDVVGQPRRIVKGISTQTYVTNMEKLINYLRQ